MDKSKRVMLLHVPIYEGDDIILNSAPPTAKGQWARQLILRQLMNEARGREKIQKAIEEEIKPWIAKVNDTMGTVIDEKLNMLLPTWIQAVQRAIAAENGRTLADEWNSDVEDIPAWRKASQTRSDWR